MINYYSLQDIRQTKEYAQFMEKLGWKVLCLQGGLKDTSEVVEWIPPRWRNKQSPRGLKKEKTYIYIKKLPLLPFSVAKILRSRSFPPVNKLKNLAKKHKIIFTKIQPFNIKNLELKTLNLGFKIDKFPLIPTKTIWINLKKTEKQLLRGMDKKVRYSINFSKRKGVKTKVISGDKMTNKQLNEFYKIWSKNKPHNWLFKPNFNELKYLVESFEKRCFLVFAYAIYPMPYALISGVLILTSKNMAFDWFGATTLLGRKLLAKPLVLCKAIKESKKRGLKVFDFEGIYDKRFHKLNKGWIGFSNFKKGFGGKEVNFIKPVITSFSFFSAKPPVLDYP